MVIYLELQFWSESHLICIRGKELKLDQYILINVEFWMGPSRNQN